MNVGPSCISMTYESFGDPADPPVLLIMGGNAQMIHWPAGFCSELIARGLHVIRFDNRDAGRSTHFRDAAEPDFLAAYAGDFSSVSYTLADMADDTVGLLDVLGIGSAHLVGQSMGGMIAQAIAIEHPARVRSLTSISSNTGDPTVGQVPAYGDRTEKLRQLRVPTLVMHGAADPSIEGGRATAAAIPDSKLVIFEGMGHNLPRELWSTIAGHIAELVHSAEKPT